MFSYDISIISCFLERSNNLQQGGNNENQTIEIAGAPRNCSVVGLDGCVHVYENISPLCTQDLPFIAIIKMLNVEPTCTYI